jgi:polyhydroxyalkanoate synthesis regulator phasin
MDQKQVFKQMSDFNKTAFDNSFNAIVMLQDQAVSLSNTLLTQATWLPEEGKKAIDEWVKTYKTGRETFKKSVDESYNKIEDFFKA